MGTSVARCLRLPKGSFFLLGPRGTGKSTWVRAELPRAHLIDLLDESLYQSYLANPALFAAELRALPPKAWVVVDEIQRLPGLLNEVHRAMEDRGLRFALTGSSARKLRRGGVNLLGGRASRLTMFPFVPEELGEAFEIDRALSHGTLPIVWSSPDPKGTLVAYVQTYLKEEIQAEAVVRNLPGFARFLPIVALHHGAVINVAGTARDAAVSRTTVQGYVEILEDTLLATRLPAFEGKLRVRERKHPKLYFADPGIVRALKKQLGPITSEERGPALEGLVHMLLRFYGERDELFDDLAYWSPAEARDTEVDFVLRRGKEAIAMEVKSATRFRATDLRGLRAIADLPGLSRRILVYLGERALSVDGMDVLPLGALAAELAKRRLWRD